MQSTLSPRPTIQRPVKRRRPLSPRRTHPQGAHRAVPACRSLARYLDEHDRLRELVAHEASSGTLLVVDRDAATHGDARLLAHLAADEPAENASLVCEHYLQEPRSDRRRCRALTDEDFSVTSIPAGDGELECGHECRLGSDAVGDRVLDPRGCSYALERVNGRTSIPQLRWCLCAEEQAGGARVPVSLRDVVAHLESYEPVCALTRQALARHGEDPEISTAVLRAELVRVQESPIVLNRRLREAVLATVAREELSMSEIAVRCGRIKRDCKGHESGETSWLARRLGLLPDGGGSTPTPWIHSDVLGLIARRGLGLSPREVEV